MYATSTDWVRSCFQNDGSFDPTKCDEAEETQVRDELFGQCTD